MQVTNQNMNELVIENNIYSWKYEWKWYLFHYLFSL